MVFYNLAESLYVLYVLHLSRALEKLTSEPRASIQLEFWDRLWLRMGSLKSPYWFLGQAVELQGLGRGCETEDLLKSVPGDAKPHRESMAEL